MRKIFFNNEYDFVSVLNTANRSVNKSFDKNTKVAWYSFKKEIYLLSYYNTRPPTLLKNIFNHRWYSWKNDLYYPLFNDLNKKEMCRICETQVYLKHYYSHIYYCMSNVLNHRRCEKNTQALIKLISRAKDETDSVDSNNEEIGELINNIENDTKNTLKEYINNSSKYWNNINIVINLLTYSLCKVYTQKQKKYWLNLLKESVKKCEIVSEVLTFHEMKWKSNRCNNREYLIIPYNQLKTNRQRQQVLNKSTFNDKWDFVFPDDKKQCLNKSCEEIGHVDWLNDSTSNNGFHLDSNSNENDIKNSSQNSENSFTNTNTNTNSFDSSRSNSLQFGKLSTDYSTVKIQSTLSQLQEIEKDNSWTNHPLKSKFSNEATLFSSNDNPEPTIEIYSDSETSKQNSNSSNFDNPIISTIPKISDFIYILPIAKGGYGRVDLYKKSNTGDIYAIKTVNISSIHSKSQATLLKNETKIINKINCDHIVKCYYILNENNNFHFITDYMPGKDWLGWLNTFILSYNTIQLIVAEIILGLEYWHSHNIIHKDIKPENVVISKDGHFKLTDFGISEVYEWKDNKYIIDNLNWSFSPPASSKEDSLISPKRSKQNGTLQYMAPECWIYNQNDCSNSNSIPITSKVDYWALGVLVYELFTLKTPFQGKTPEEINMNIIKGDINWSWFDLEYEGENYSYNELNNSKDLIIKLWKVDPESRWGVKEIMWIKNHCFFKGFNWEMIKSTRDKYVWKYVKQVIEQTNEGIKKKLGLDRDSNDLDGIVIQNDKTSNDNCYMNKGNNTERVDNMFKKCQEMMRNVVKSKKYENKTKRTGSGKNGKDRMEFFDELN